MTTGFLIIMELSGNMTGCIQSVVALLRPASPSLFQEIKHCKFRKQEIPFGIVSHYSRRGMETVKVREREPSHLWDPEAGCVVSLKKMVWLPWETSAFLLGPAYFRGLKQGTQRRERIIQ